MKAKIEEFLRWADEKGWDIKHRQGLKLDIPSTILLRFSKVPDEYVEFLKLVDVCVAPDSKSWFLCLNDYNGSSDSAYSWDDIEKICLDEAEEDDDWKVEITEFWNEHLPIVFSVRSGYAYYALNVGSNFGSVVFGYEPEFEETELVASSFSEFLDKVMTNNIEV